MITGAEVAKHNSFHSCWVIIANNVYDVTELVNEHPGGPNSILRWAGQVTEGSMRNEDTC